MAIQAPIIVQSAFLRVDSALTATLGLDNPCVTGNSLLIMGLGSDSFFPVNFVSPPGPPTGSWYGLAADYTIVPYGTFGQVLSWGHLVADGDDSQHVKVSTYSIPWAAISWGLFEIAGDIQAATLATSYNFYSHDLNCWDPTSSFTIGNIVSWIGYSWACTAPNSNQQPYAGSSYWAQGGSSASSTPTTSLISNPGQSLCIGGFTWKSADTSTSPGPSPYATADRSNDPAGNNSLFFSATGSPLPSSGVSVTLPNAAHWVDGWVLISVYSSSTAVVTDGSPSVSGVPVTFTATVTTTQGDPPVGDVTFSDSLGSFSPQTVPLSGGTAQFLTPDLSVDLHTITAAYNGDTEHASSYGTVTQSVQYAVPSVEVLSSLSPSPYGDPVTFTVNVTGGYGTPTGSVVLSDDLGGFSPQTLPLVLGSAQYTASSLGLDYHNISAAYGGDGVYSPLASVLVQEVVPKYIPVMGISSSATPQSFGQAFTLTVTVGPQAGVLTLPTGTVDIIDSIQGDLGTQGLVGGQVTYTMDLLHPWPAGSHGITATYNGDGSYSTGTASLVQLIVPASSLVYADVPGFALAASYSMAGDEGLPAWASFSADPDPAYPGEDVYLLWTSSNIASVSMSGSNGMGDSLDTGLLQAGGSGGLYAVTGGFQNTIVLSCTAYDSLGNVVASQSLAITVA